MNEKTTDPAKADPVTTDAAAKPGDPAAKPATDAAPKPDGEVTTAVPVTEPATSATPPAQTPSWALKRIDKLTAEKKAAEEQLAALKAQQVKPTADKYKVPARETPLTQEQIDQIANRKAMEMRFNDRCATVYNDGKKNFEDFDTRIKELTKLGDDPGIRKLIEVALETDNPSKVLYDVAADLDNATNLMALNPVKLGIELSKLANAEAKPKAAVEPPKDTTISRAADPVKSVVTKGNGSNTQSTVEVLTNPDVDMKEWAKARIAQRRAIEEARRQR